jgi:Tetratricopeptide repeat
VTYVLPFRSDDWNMASDLRNLAFHYYESAPEQTESLFRRTLMVSEAHDLKTFDDESRKAKFNLTEQSLNDLAIFYYDQRRYGEAEPLFRRAIALCEQRLGADHAVTAAFRKNLALLLQVREHDGEESARD